MTRAEKPEGFVGQQIIVLPKPVVASALQQPVLRDLLITDIGHYPQAAGHLRERRIGIDQAIFIYCTHGSGWCEMGGQRRIVAAGELLVIPPNASHAYGADEKRPWTIYWVHAAGAALKLLLTELGTSEERPVVFLGQDSQLAGLFEEALNVLEHGYTTSHLLYGSRVLGHLLGLMIWHRQQKWQTDPKPRQNMAQSVAYMKRHLHQHLKASHLAAMANLSVPHYSALFKRHTGYSPIEYFNRLRMHQACRLLDNTDMSVKEIAASLGYDDPFYFSRIFKTLNDISPSDYRHLHKG
jgi:AraC-like DNA-binding protein